VTPSLQKPTSSIVKKSVNVETAQVGILKYRGPIETPLVILAALFGHALT